MKQYFYAFSMCQSMFCSIPFPCHQWVDSARSKMLLFLPVIGLEIGAIWVFAGWLGRVLQLSPMVLALIMTLIPYLTTGFLHLDGFMDVTDAIGSCRDLEKRRAILKDSHVGSFAVIGLVILVLSMFALFTAAQDHGDFRALLLVPCISRTTAGLGVLTLKKMNTSQYHDQVIQKGQVVYMSLVLAASIILSVLCFGAAGLSGPVCCAVCGLAIRKGYRSLEGMNGDISGYSITIGELAAVAVLALC